MAISDEENIYGHEERYKWHYVYVQNLPWTACQSELLTFFKDLFIEEGCILIHGSEAFVAFKDSLTATKAMLKSGSLLHGTLIDISLVDKKFISKILFRNVCRTLKFDDQIVSRKQNQLRHKIRPTRINGARPTNSCSFLPDEIDYTENMSKRTENLSYSSMEIKHSNKIKKKIHPTNVDDAYNSRFPVFHPEYCYEAKRIRLASSASLDI